MFKVPRKIGIRYFEIEFATKNFELANIFSISSNEIFLNNCHCSTIRFFSFGESFEPPIFIVPLL